MDRRDWELLDKQLQGPDPSRRNDGVPVLTVVAVFFLIARKQGTSTPVTAY
jgi:hypothetical protein